MPTFCLLLAAAFMPPAPVPVQASILEVSQTPYEQQNEVDWWIPPLASKRDGFPHVRTVQPWRDLDQPTPELYTDPAHGISVSAVTAHNDKLNAIELTGQNLAFERKLVVLRPGQRQLIPLSRRTKSPKLFLALRAPLDRTARQRKTQLITDLASFECKLERTLKVPDDHLCSILSTVQLTLTTAKTEPTNSISDKSHTLTREEALRLIDLLACDGSLATAQQSPDTPDPPEKQTDGHIRLTVRAGDHTYSTRIPRDLAMYYRLYSWRDALTDDSDRMIDSFLERFKADLEPWQQQTVGFSIVEDKPDSSINTRIDEFGHVTLKVTSASGIGSATISRTHRAWPEALTVQLTLKGLESFQITTPSHTLEVSVHSDGTRTATWHQPARDGQPPRETILNPDDPRFPTIDQLKPDADDPVYSVSLPPDFLDKDADSFTIRWIDFYR